MERNIELQGGKLRLSRKIKIRHVSAYNVAVLVSCITLLWIFSVYGITYVPASSMSDQIMYKNLYNTGNVDMYFEVGYLFLCEVGALIGLTYQNFKTILAVITYILISKRLKNYGVKYLFLLFLYILTAFPYDMEQTRSFFASGVVIYATQYLSEYSRKNVIRYILLIILAAMMHVSSLAYLVFVILFFKKREKIIFILEIITVALCCFGLINGNDFSIIGKLLYFIIPRERIIFWFSQSTNWGFLGIWLFYFVILFALKYIVNSMGKVIDKRKKFVFDVYMMMRLLCIMLPFYMIATDFVRIIRCLFLLLFSAILVGTDILIKERCSTSLEKTKLLLGMRGSMILVSLVFLWMYQYAAVRVLSAF